MLKTYNHLVNNNFVATRFSDRMQFVHKDHPITKTINVYPYAEWTSINSAVVRFKVCYGALGYIYTVSNLNASSLHRTVKKIVEVQDFET